MSGACWRALAPYLLTLAVGAAVRRLLLRCTLRGPDVHWRHTRRVRAARWRCRSAPGSASTSSGGASARWRSRARTICARTPQGAFGHLLHLPRALRLVAIGLVAVALARPQRLSTDPAEVEGIDIVVALDVSNSMRETDLAARSHRRRQAGDRRLHPARRRPIASAW